MADKPDEKTPDEESKQREGAASILESAQEIWLAGVGAFAKAQREGSKIFQSLVRAGREVEHRRETASATGLEFGEKAEQMRERAAVSLDRLEHVIENRLAKVLDRLDLPRKSDFEALSRRIERLEKTLEETRSGAGAATRKRTVKAAAGTRKKRTS